MHSFRVLIAIMATTLFTVVGDSFLKKANDHAARFMNVDFYIGLVMYMMTAYMWVMIYRMTKFSLSGVVYSILGMVVFVFMGVFMFGEKLSVTEYVGIGMALSSMIILARFL
ncbi:MAG: hypothetical protein WAV41_02595 [Microgenomates group bacterium]